MAFITMLAFMFVGSLAMRDDEIQNGDLDGGCSEEDCAKCSPPSHFKRLKNPNFAFFKRNCESANCVWSDEDTCTQPPSIDDVEVPKILDGPPPAPVDDDDEVEVPKILDGPPPSPVDDDEVEVPKILDGPPPPPVGDDEVDVPNILDGAPPTPEVAVTECTTVEMSKLKTLSENTALCVAAGCKYVTPADADYAIVSGACCPKEVEITADVASWQVECAGEFEVTSASGAPAEDAKEASSSASTPSDADSEVDTMEDGGSVNDDEETTRTTTLTLNRASEEDEDVVDAGDEIAEGSNCKAVAMTKSKTLDENMELCAASGCQYIKPVDTDYAVVSGICCPEELEFSPDTWQALCSGGI